MTVKGNTLLFICLTCAVTFLSACGIFEKRGSVELHVPFASAGRFVVRELGTERREIASGDLKQADDGASEATARFRVGGNHLPLEITVTEIEFTDPASGVLTRFDRSDQWRAYIEADTAPETLTANPFTTLASCLADSRLGEEDYFNGDVLSDAIATTNGAFARHLGVDTLTEAVPSGLSGNVGNVTTSVRYGLWIAGFSQLAADHSTRTGVSSGSLLTMVSLTERLCGDVEGDGAFDGAGASGPVQHGGVRLTDQTLRLDLARGLYDFLSLPRNQTGLGPNDAFGLTDTVTFNASTILFPSGLPVYPFEIIPPKIQFLEPKVTSWSGTVFDVKAIADDRPGAVAGVRAVVKFPLSGFEFEVPNAADAVGVFEASVDLTEYGYGPATFEMNALDLSGNRAEASVELNVQAK